MEILENFAKLSPEKKKKVCRHLYKQITANVINPTLAKNGDWIAALICNYNIETTPQLDKMFAFVDDGKIISNYYNVSADPKILNLIPYLFIDRVDKDITIRQNKNKVIFEFEDKVETRDLTDTRIAFYSLMDNLVIRKVNPKYLKQGVFEFSLKGLPPPIYRIPDDIRLLL